MDPAWTDLGTGVAAISAIVYIVRSMRHIVKDQQTWMGNHLSELTASLAATARAMQRLADRLERVEDAVERRAN